MCVEDVYLKEFMLQWAESILRCSMYPPFCNSLSFFNAMFHFKRFLVLYPVFFITDFAELKMLVSHITIEENVDYTYTIS